MIKWKEKLSDIIKKLYFLRASRLVLQGAPVFTTIILAIVVIQGLLSVATIYVNKLILDTVADTSTNFNAVLSLLGIAWLISLISSASNSASHVMRRAQSEKVTNQFHSIMHTKAIDVDIDCYENPDYHDKLHRTQEESSYRPTQVVEGMVELARQSIVLFFIAGLVFQFDGIWALLLLLSCIPQAMIRWKYGLRFHNWMLKRTPEQRQSWFLHWMLTVSFHAKEMRSYLLGPLFKKQYSEIQETLRKEKLHIFLSRNLFEFLCSLISTGCFYGAYLVVIHQTILGHWTIGSMVMYFQAFQKTQSTFQDMLLSLGELYENHLFLSNFYEFLDIPKLVTEPENPTTLPSCLSRGISINNLSFQYPRGHRKVLNNICLTIEPGKIVALVGENGSGKSTLVKLLCRFYDPTHGQIMMDGEDLRNFSTQDLWKQIGVMFQDFSQYPASARENIWYGACYTPAIQQDIESCAQLSGAEEFIKNLEYGYDTILNKSFENGEELSMGEWQKIALARLFYKKASILILDEPTSFMDAKSEAQFFHILRKYASIRTTILISHKLPVIKIADEIFVLDHGQIVEHGKHEELIKNKGKYAWLFSEGIGTK